MAYSRTYRRGRRYGKRSYRKRTYRKRYAKRTYRKRTYRKRSYRKKTYGRKRGVVLRPIENKAIPELTKQKIDPETLRAIRKFNAVANSIASETHEVTAQAASELKRRAATDVDTGKPFVFASSKVGLAPMVN